jgi:hypothetical protein
MYSLQTTSKLDRTQPLSIYYDLDVINSDRSGLNAPVKLRFQETRNNPYLEAPENYMLSVVRFSLHTPSLPVFIPLVELGQANPNKTVYSITMTYVVGGNTITHQEFIIYTPEDLSAPVPNPPLVNQDITSDYYYVKSYQHIVKMINTTLANCLIGLNNAIVGAGGVALTTTPPYLDFDMSSFKAILASPQVAFDLNLGTPYKLYFNSPLYHILTSFPAFYYGYLGITQGKNYQLNIYTTPNNGNVLLGATNYLLTYQEDSSIAMMNPIQSIVFTTALLPVVSSNISNPKVFGVNTTNLFNSGENSNLAPVITDFEVPMGVDNTFRPNIQYTPTAEYRFVDLYGSSPISSIELSVYWKDNYNILHPFILNSGCSGNVKLLFRRRDFGNINLPIT